ncbi:cell surface A33 antigen-like [Brachionichthys hirsutus]|uniref:cell surface A33 antigen-like n=1 Tax=Brachionichthys hirsutus TaxID=412623 RepID=UPI0036049FEB
MEFRISTLILLSLALSGVAALTVKISDDGLFEAARGDNITLPCTFTSTIPSPKLVIVAWSVEAASADVEDLRILTYFSNDGALDIKSQYEGRVSLEVNVATGKANLKLSSITLEDNKVFVCRVTIRGDDEGTPVASARLVVLVAPSVPVCKIQGKAQYGQNINLTCKSDEGSPPPAYTWVERDVKNLPRAPSPRTTDKNGVLSLFNISRDTSGFYICTSSNKIRSASCNLTLAVMPPSVNIGSTAGIIAGVVAALVVLVIVIYCCCCRKKKQQEEYAMGVREEEYHDKEPARNGDSRQVEGQEDRENPDDSSVRNTSDRYEDRSERDYDRRRDHDDRRSDHDDHHREDRPRSDYDDPHRDYDDRRSDYSAHRDRYDDRYDGNDDDRRDRRHDDRYDEPYDDRRERDRPRAPASNPPRSDDDY